MSATAALDRSVRLINGDFFLDKASPEAIVHGLLGTTVHIKSDRENLASSAGQTLLMTLVGQLAMMGIGVDLSIPGDVELLQPQPPLRGTGLLAGLIDYGQDLIPGLRIGQGLGPPHLTFLLGDTPSDDASALRISGDAWTCQIEPAGLSGGTCWAGCWPIGALAGAGAAAPEALRVALGRIAAVNELELEGSSRYEVSRQIRIDLSLPGATPAQMDVGALDFISGGAITTAALYVLLRLPVCGTLRIFEPDSLDISNLNRYPLMRRSDCGLPKVEVFARYARQGLSIMEMPRRLDEHTISSIGPLASRVLVGVDDIPSRWVVQRAFPDWLCVGSTSHLFALVSAHRPEEPCAGCLHPRDDEGPERIPTISFVSFWAGLLQVRELIAHLLAYSTAQSMYCYPFGLDGRHALHPVGVTARRDCPVQCPASSLLRNTSTSLTDEHEF